MALPIHRLFTRVGRSFLVEHRGVLTLVDTGTQKVPPRIRRALEKLGKTPGEVRQILVTHSHGDHAGGAKAMRELCEAPVFAGAADVDVIAGREGYVMAPAALGRVLYSNRLKDYPRFEVDHAVDDRTEVEGGLEMVPVPGHTPGHMAVWAPDLQALFVGDSVWNLPRVKHSWKAFTWDWDLNRESVQRLTDLPSESLWFGHGFTVKQGGKARLRSLAARRGPIPIEGREVLNQEVERLRDLSYEELKRYFEVDVRNIKASSGVEYQVEVQAFWDGGKAGPIRVLVTAWPVWPEGAPFAPTTEDFIKAPDGSFIGE